MMSSLRLLPRVEALRHIGEGARLQGQSPPDRDLRPA